MVHRKATKRKAVKKKSKSIWRLMVYVVFFGAMIAGITLAVLMLVFRPQLIPDKENISNEEEIMTTEPEPEIILPDKIDFQAIIDDWVKTSGGKKSVLVYDLERDEMVGEYNPNESYDTASLYKLFVVLEGYRRVQAGEWQAEEIAGSTGKTISQCLDLAIRESYSPCAEVLWSKIGRAELDDIVRNDYNIVNSDIPNLISNPTDILAVMKLFYEHKNITDETLLSQIKDSFLNQPATTYNWRQGLPSGFTKANVYNKVGWDFNPDGNYWNIYHDAAIVEFPESNRHYIVVVMSNRLPFQQIRKLGTNIEKHFYGEL